MLSKKKDYIFCSLFGAYIAAVLWVTLFSRIGDGYRRFLLPFHSYVEIFRGNRQFLFENIGNVILFIPLGVALKCSGVRDVKKTGFFASLLIEILQFTFALGTFECDDLIHNTLGAIIGAWCVGKIGGEVKLNWKMGRVVLLSMVLCSMVPFGYQEVWHQKMVRYAAINNREDGVDNLLVLNGDNGRISGTKVSISYLDDGAVLITGSSDKRVCKEIGYVYLEKGNYSFSVYDSRQINTGQGISIIGEYYDKELGDFVRLEPIDNEPSGTQFVLGEYTKIYVYINIYKDSEKTFTVRPVIYKEE